MAEAEGTIYTEDLKKGRQTENYRTVSAYANNERPNLVYIERAFFFLMNTAYCFKLGFCRRLYRLV